MLRLLIIGEEFFNEETSEFESYNDVELELEHSLISLSKWESKYQIPFLSTNEKTPEQIFYYVEAML